MRATEPLRYRVEFAKEGPARFLSHLDLQEAIERALRRARLPLAFRGGFHPRPRLQFEDPLPLGWESERERLWIELQEAWPSGSIARRLRAVAPPGVRILRVFREAGRPRPPRARRFLVRGLQPGPGAREALAQRWPDPEAPAGRSLVELEEDGDGCRLTLRASGGGNLPGLKKVLEVLGGPAALRLPVRRLDWEPGRPAAPGGES